MKRIPILISIAVLSLTLFACSQVTNAIDSFFTFNVSKSAQIPFPALTPTNTLISAPLPLTLDSATIAQNGTTVSLIRTAKLTALKFTFSDPTFSMPASFDTIIFSVTNPTLGTHVLATYSPGLDSMFLTGYDFSAFLKDTASKFPFAFELKADPKQDMTATINYTLTLTALPQ